MAMENRTEFVSFLDVLARDPSAIDSLSARGLEIFVAHMLASQGHEVTFGSKGADLSAVLHIPLGTINTIVTCKKRSRDRPIGVSDVRMLYGMAQAKRVTVAALITTSNFSRGALEFAQVHGAQLHLVDREALLRMALQTREQQNEKAQSIAFALTHLPLNTVERIDAARLAEPEKLILPDEFARRIQSVDGLPLALLKAASADPRTMHGLSPRQFEVFVAELVDHIGFSDVVLTPRSCDGGKDVIASKIIHGIPLTFYFECKKYAEGNKVQLETLRALLGVVAHDSRKANIGVLVTTSTFTAGSRELILSECRLDGKDYAGITDWISDFRRRYK